MFDYVIVGAGSAGCVLAARLGEDRDVRVGVIEAGPPDDEPVIHTPLTFRQLWESRFDWGLWSEREPGLGDRRDTTRGAVAERAVAEHLGWPRRRLDGQQARRSKPPLLAEGSSVRASTPTGRSLLS